MKRILFALLVVACGKSSPPPAAPAPVESSANPVEPAGAAEPSAETQPPAAAPAAPEPPPAPAAPPPPKEAKADLAPTAKSKSKTTGTITFKEVEAGVEVTATVEGLKPSKAHAWHIHEKGDCSAPDASSAGDHFNPDGRKHGGPEAEERHAGDFGNLTADKQGKASQTVVMKGITVAEGPTSIVGKGFIVHEKKDDLKSQPSGNAGGRIACGVIEVAQ